MMTIDFVSLIFICLLPLTASSTLSSNVKMTTQETASLRPLSEVSTQSSVVAVNPTEDKTTEQSTKPPLQTAGTRPSETFLPDAQTAAAPSNSISSQLNSSTEGIKSTTDGHFQVTASATMVLTSQAVNPTTTTSVPAMITSSTTQSQDTGKTLTSQTTSDKTIHSTQSANLISTTATSTKAVDSKSTSPVTSGDTMKSTGLYKTSLATTKRPSIHTKKKPKTKPEQNQQNPGKAVAWIIGGALVLMMVGFLVIYIKKRKLHRQQITTSEWAGPSPFLEGGADNGQVNLRSSNRISFSSFLPQRLSKRLSLLPERDEEMEDMTPRTTFGDKHQETILGCDADENDVKESNGTSKSTGDAPETVENSVSVSSSQKSDLLSTNNNSAVTNLSEDHPANPPTPSGAEENTAQVNDGFGQS